MSLIDVVIIITLILFAFIGFKRGVFKSLVMFLGFIIIIFLAYALKNYIGDFLVLNLPFIKFGDFLGGAATLNIIMYQSLAFILVLIVLGLIYNFLVAISGVFEKLLRITIILGIPSKLLGMVVGLLEGYIIVYLVLFFLTQPFLNAEDLKNNNYVSTILNNTPVISSFAEDSLRIVNEVREVTEIKNKEQMDLKLADLILKEKVTTYDVMQKLVDKKKITVDGIQDIIDKYASDANSGGE